jgi:peptidoglycan hydrolase-like protein with peptidoglycan-binding domain
MQIALKRSTRYTVREQTPETVYEPTYLDRQRVANPPEVPSRLWPTRLLVAAALLAAGTAIGWAAGTVFAPPADVVDSTPFTTAEVVEGEVGSSFSVNTVAEWEPVPVASNLASGTVTSIALKPGEEVRPGSPLYSVNLRRVVIAEGAIPAFRAMSFGDRGADIGQLQALLAALGYYHGSTDGSFGSGTATAVRTWQRSVGLDSTGVVQLGDVVFVPRLPARVTLDPKVISRGASLSGGEPAIFALPESPSFRVPVTKAQAAKMPNGTRVDVTGPDQHVWVGVVVDQEPQKQGDDVDVVLAGVGDAPLCGSDCDSIGVAAQSVLPSKVVTLETVRGLTVPSAALLSKPDGTIAVIEEDGTEHPVTVVASAEGISVVEGISAGSNVRVPAGGS